MVEKATYRMDKEKELESLDDLVKLSSFVDVEVGIAAVKTINEVINRVMEKIGEIFAPVNWSLLLTDKKTKKLYFKLIVGKNASKLKNKRIPKEENITNKVVKTGQPILIEDVQKDPKLSNRIDKITGFKAKSIIGVPLKLNDKIIGVIQLINKKNKKPFSQAEIKILTTIADYAATAIENVYYLSSLKNLANIDSLTGVYNKSNFDKQLNKEIERYKRYNHGFSLIIIDINDFKKINDQHGNSVGDNILKNLARILKKNTRTVDIVARYGGDEFVILLPHTKKRDAENVCKRITKNIEQENKKGKKNSYTVSITLKSAEDDKISNSFPETDKIFLKKKARKKSKDIKEISKHFQEMFKKRKKK